MKRDEAIRMRAIIEQAAASLPDKEASEVPTLQSAAANADAWWDGHLINAGERIRFGESLYRASNALYAHRHYAPDQAPDLWEAVVYRDGYRVISGSISAANPVQPGEIVWIGEQKYRNISGVATTHLPDVYPAGWEAVA